MADALPVDPDFDDETLHNSRMGIHKTAQLLGTLRRELLAEGFEPEEALGLCETWMIEALLGIKEEDE